MKSIIASLLLAISLAAFGQTEKPIHATVLLTDAASVLEACKTRFPESGIYCAIDGADAPIPGQYFAGVSLSQSQMLPWDRGHSFKLYGVLVLTTQATEHGFSYMRGTLTAYKSNAIIPGFSTTDAYWAYVWSAVQYVMPSAAQESGNEASIEAYLASADKQIVTNQQRALAAAAAASEAADVTARQSAYAQTDEAKRKAAAAAIHSCRNTIIRAQHAIDQDERVARISGYVNKYVREQAGLATVNCEDEIVAQWAVYKAHGGTAATPASLP